MKHNIYPIWRPAYELYACMAWLGVAGIMFWLEQGGGALAMYLRALWIFALALAVIRIGQCFQLWQRKVQFSMQGDFEMNSKQLDKTLRRAKKLARKGRLKVET